MAFGSAQGALHERIAGRFGWAEPWARVRAYVSGLVAGLERENGWTLAEKGRQLLESLPYPETSVIISWSPKET